MIHNIPSVFWLSYVPQPVMARSAVCNCACVFECYAFIAYASACFLVSINTSWYVRTSQIPIYTNSGYLRLSQLYITTSLTDNDFIVACTYTYMCMPNRLVWLPCLSSLGKCQSGEWFTWRPEYSTLHNSTLTDITEHTHYVHFNDAVEAHSCIDT